MMPAYNEIYLNDAMQNLGEAFDYAVRTCHIPLNEFWNIFALCGFAGRFGKGEPQLVCGLSGTELVMDILRKIKYMDTFEEPPFECDRSPEYWCGWVLAYYQWKTGRTFKDIHEVLSGDDLLCMYPTLHEASEEKFVDAVDHITEQKRGSTKLQRFRKNCGYSQKELAEQAHVNLRTLQAYEQGIQDINKASVQTVQSLSIVLGCQIEDLLEYHVAVNT